MGRDAASDELGQLQIVRLQGALFKLPAFLATQGAANVIVGEFGFDSFQLFKEPIVGETILLEAVGLALRQLSQEGNGPAFGGCGRRLRVMNSMIYRFVSPIARGWGGLGP